MTFPLTGLQGLSLQRWSLDLAAGLQVRREQGFLFPRFWSLGLKGVPCPHPTKFLLSIHTKSYRVGPVDEVGDRENTSMALVGALWL